jgi:hypothetical protein
MLVKFWIDTDQWEDSEFSKNDWHEGYLTTNKVITVGFYIQPNSMSFTTSDTKNLTEIIPNSGIYSFQGKISKIYKNYRGGNSVAIVDCGIPISINVGQGIENEYNSIYGFGMLWGETSFALDPVSPVKCIFKDATEYGFGTLNQYNSTIHYTSVLINDGWETLEADHRLSLIYEHKLVYKSK